MRRRWGDARGWNVRTRTFESCAWESVAPEEICEAGAESTAVLADVACDAAEVEVVGVEDDAGVSVPAVGRERSQWGIAPPKPPETRIGCTGYALAHRIPAQARAATLAPWMGWYRAHRLRLDVCARAQPIQGIGSVSRSSIELVLGHVGHLLSRAPCAWETRRT